MQCQRASARDGTEAVRVTALGRSGWSVRACAHACVRPTGKSSPRQAAAASSQRRMLSRLRPERAFASTASLESANGDKAATVASARGVLRGFCFGAQQGNPRQIRENFATTRAVADSPLRICAVRMLHLAFSLARGHALSRQTGPAVSYSAVRYVMAPNPTLRWRLSEQQRRPPCRRPRPPSSPIARSALALRTGTPLPWPPRSSQMPIGPQPARALEKPTRGGSAP